MSAATGACGLGSLAGCGTLESLGNPDGTLTGHAEPDDGALVRADVSARRGRGDEDGERAGAGRCAAGRGGAAVAGLTSPTIASVSATAASAGSPDGAVAVADAGCPAGCCRDAK